MQLSGQKIIELGIINNYCEKGIQQQGIDVRVNNIYELNITESCGVIRTTSSIIPKVSEVSLVEESDGQCWKLPPGYYEIKLEEGCKIPSNCTLHFKTRSSLVRSGAIVHSGQFDAGFKTNNMGCFLQVINPIIIYKNARIAQAIVFESYDVDSKHLYNGQWQNDNQRDKI